MDGPKDDFSSGSTFIFFTYYILINIEASAMKNQLWVLVHTNILIKYAKF